MPQEEKFYLATARCEAKYGARKLTVKMIANEAGCSEALLYKYFNDLDELYLKTFLYGMDRIITKFEKIQESDPYKDLTRKERIIKEWEDLARTIINDEYSLFTITYARSISARNHNLNAMMESMLATHPYFQRVFDDIFEGTDIEPRKRQRVFAYILATISYYTCLRMKGYIDYDQSVLSTMEEIIFNGLFTTCKITD